jgi:hypothetical protein
MKWVKALSGPLLSAARRRAVNFCKALDRKPLFSALYGMYAVTLNELKAVLMVSAQAGQSDAVNKTSVESAAHVDDFQEVKRRKRHVSNNISQTAVKSTKLAPTSAAVKLPPKAALTRNFFAPLESTDMDTETTEAESTLPEREAPRKPGDLHFFYLLPKFRKAYQGKQSVTFPQTRQRRYFQQP